MTEKYFQGTCDVFDLSTCKDAVLLKKYLDPCSCENYYQCTNNYGMTLKACAGGTAWNYITGVCDHKNEVLFNQPCDTEKDVWTRCNSTEARIEELHQICTNSSGTTQTPVTLTSSEDNVDPVIVMGSVAAGAVITLMALVMIYVLYKRRHKNKINKGRSNIMAHNPEYFEGGQPEDQYAVINEAHIKPATDMSDPAYNGASGGGTLNQANGCCTNTGFDDIDEDIEYDNSAERIVRAGYTCTLRRSIREYETPLSVQASDPGLLTTDTTSDMTNNGLSDNIMNRDHKSGGNLHVDENGNKNSTDGGGHGSADRAGNDAASSVVSGSEGLIGHTHEDAPDYYVLEKSEL